MNNKLQSVYENYNKDTICITDRNGIIEVCGEDTEPHCGVKSKEFLGLHIKYMQDQGYYKPIVTLKVLETKKTEVAIQNTLAGTTLITVAMPLFDDNGELDKVISISRDFSREFEIAKMLTKVGVDVVGKEINKYESSIVTCSSKIYSIMTLIKTVAPTETTIMLTGETGTGKTMYARYLHNNSKRADKPFYSINCGSIAENLIETELFGYEPNTFTGADKEGRKGIFETAEGGTVFLDEIGELPMAQQVKLLHVLQEKTIMRVGGRKQIDVDVRVVAATNKNLPEMVEQGLFREDLYYRLNVISIHIPPLRERREDIPLLIKHFIQKMNERNHMYKEISSEALELLSSYRWPGNVRELENIVEMLCVTTGDDEIEAEHIPEKIRSQSKDNVPFSLGEGMSLKEALKAAEKQILEKALRDCGGDQYKAAKLLKVDRSTVTRKVNQYGIDYKS